MTAARLSRATVEALIQTDPAARLSRATVEALIREIPVVNQGGGWGFIPIGFSVPDTGTYGDLYEDGY